MVAVKSLTLVAVILINTSLEIGRFRGDIPTITRMRKMRLRYGPKKAQPIPINLVKKQLHQPPFRIRTAVSLGSNQEILLLKKMILNGIHLFRRRRGERRLKIDQNVKLIFGFSSWTFAIQMIEPAQQCVETGANSEQFWCKQAECGHWLYAEACEDDFEINGLGNFRAF